MKLYKLKKDSDYVTQGEDIDVEKHLNWWVGKYTLIIEKHLIKTMEKLERDFLFKALCSYLPWKLKCKGQNKEINYIPLTVNNIKKCINCVNEGWLHDYHKPILRPLSDLTKEIEHNGKKFIPLMVLASDGFEDRELKRFYIESDNETFFNVMYNTGSPDDDCIFSIDTPIKFYTKHYIVQKLHEWHFDTEGLIEKGLAIDKNKL